MASGLCFSRTSILFMGYGARTRPQQRPKPTRRASWQLQFSKNQQFFASALPSSVLLLDWPPILSSRRQLLLLFATTVVAVVAESAIDALANADDHYDAQSLSSIPKKLSILDGLLDTRSWNRFRGDGFSISIPPDFEDILEPEDNESSSLYGERAKPRTFAAHFASSDRSEVLSVVIRPASAIKITFLEAREISDFGSLKDAVNLFVPGGATLLDARTIRLKNSETPRTYYYYEFSTQGKHVALEASISRGKVYVVGATAPQSKWNDNSVKLRSAALSFSLA